jgi:hypothetical protein
MTSRDNSRYDDQLVIQYLLGETPEDQVERFDELSIVDDEFALRLTAVENDLVDAYVRGELTGTVRDRFQSHYLSSARRREKVIFAESLMVLTDRAAVSAAAGGGPRGWSWPRLFPVFAAAVCLLLIAAGLLTYRNSQLRSQLVRTQQDRAALERSQREAMSRLEKQRETAIAPPAVAVAIVLLPQTRGIGPLPAIAVPSTTRQVDFRLELESAAVAEYRVRLKVPATGQVLWRSGTVRPVSNGSVRSVSIALPGRLLIPRNYVLELSGISPEAGAELLNSYAFTVVP